MDVYYRCSPRCAFTRSVFRGVARGGEWVGGGGGVHTPSRQGRLLHPSRQNVFPLRKDELCTKGKNKNIGGKLIKKLIITAYIFTETLKKSARRS